MGSNLKHVKSRLITLVFSVVGRVIAFTTRKFTHVCHGDEIHSSHLKKSGDLCIGGLDLPRVVQEPRNGVNGTT